jgi:hypothetical protein
MTAGASSHTKALMPDRSGEAIIDRRAFLKALCRHGHQDSELLLLS